jgi:hypothetical protein
MIRIKEQNTILKFIQKNSLVLASGFDQRIHQRQILDYFLSNRVLLKKSTFIGEYRFALAIFIFGPFIYRSSINLGLCPQKILNHFLGKIMGKITIKNESVDKVARKINLDNLEVKHSNL